MSNDMYGSQFESILQSLDQMETALQKEIDKEERLTERQQRSRQKPPGAANSAKIGAKSRSVSTAVKRRWKMCFQE